jgi:hypothetical protein
MKLKNKNYAINILLNKNRIKDIIICITTLICLISISYISSSEIKINDTNENPKGRNLQYTQESIYYELKYPMNNLTGTGDRLKDVPYNVICKIKECIPCCIGEIDNITCGGYDECNVYLNERKKPNLYISIIIPVGLFVIYMVLFSTFLVIYKFSFGYSILFSILFMTIILIPCVAYLVYKKSIEIETKEKIKKR